ncbi:MAG: hypothetical protein LC648_06625 [Novosphingobium sp.]|nr:hypothetical protein [Novosphingobium sp.]
MPALKPLAPLFVALLAGCDQPSQPAAEGSAAPPSEANEAPPTPVAAPSREPPAPVAGLALPERFTALGTEPFWAATVAGGRLTYMTPEDQAGQTIAVEREDDADLVELRGTLAGKPLALTITKGPCSDGMSDVVYRWSVERRLGDDVQRGCARIDPRDASPGPASG